jgi:hypothetical protein
MARCDGDPQRIHALCFNTARQFGGAVGLLAAHLDWLGGDGEEAERLAHLAKVLQFQMARAARRGREDPAIAALLGEMATAWTTVTVAVAALLRAPDLAPAGQARDREAV